MSSNIVLPVTKVFNKDELVDISDSDETVIVNSELEDGEIQSDNSEKTDEQFSMEASSEPVAKHRRRSKRQRRPKEVKSPTPIRESIKDGDWSSINVLVVGDERVLHLDWSAWEELPRQRIIRDTVGTVTSLCHIADQNLSSGDDVLVIVGFHNELTSMEFCVENQTELLTTKPTNMDNMQYISLQKVITAYNDRWKQYFPNTRVVWTLPYPVDFYGYNSKVVRSFTDVRGVSVFTEDTKTRDYYQLLKHMGKVLKRDLPRRIQLFDLATVLFFGKENFRDTFALPLVPKFPLELLNCGFYPTEKMAVFTALHLVDFMVKQEFFPGFTKAIGTEDFNTAFVGEMSSDSLKKSRKFTKRSKSKNDSSVESVHYPKRPCSRSSVKSSSKKGGVETSSSIQKDNPHSHTKRRSREDTLSDTIPPRKHRTRRHDEHRRESRRSSHRHQRTSSSRKKSGDPSEDSLKSTDTTEDEFISVVKRLKKSFDVECEAYRKNPESHPKYKTEREMFFKQSLKLNDTANNEDSNFKQFWSQRMENLFEEKWVQVQINLSIEYGKQKSSEKASSTLLDDLPGTSVSISKSPEKALNEISPQKETPTSKEPRPESPSDDLPDSTVDMDLLEPVPMDISQEELSGIEVSTIPSPGPSDCKPLQDVAISQVDVNSEIEDDCGFDDLLNDPDFLGELEDIDKEIKSSLVDDTVPQKVTKESPSKKSISQDSGTTHLEMNTEYIYLFKMLTKAAGSLGPMGKAIVSFNEQLQTNKMNFDKCMIDEEGTQLLKIAHGRIEALVKEGLSEFQSCILQDLSEKIHGFLEKLDVFVSKFPKISIKSIVSATWGKGITATIDYIKNTLISLGYSDFVSGDVMKIFISVKKYHLSNMTSSTGKL